MQESFFDKPAEDQPWDTAIIGSGPAALTAAIYTTRGAASTLVIGGDAWGGQLMLTTAVDNFPGFPQGIQGPELMGLMRKQAERFGAEFIERRVDSIDVTVSPFKLTVGDKTYTAKSILLATGAETKWLGVPGEDKLRGRGVSSCAPCDAPFFKGKKVGVVGGGDAAMEEALVLTKYSPMVTVIHRRGEFRASQAMQQQVLSNEHIRVIWDTEVTEIIGDQTISAIKLATTLASEQAKAVKEQTVEGGHVLGEFDDKLLWQLPTEGLFVAIGHIPSTSLFAGAIELDEKGYIKRTERDGFRMTTSVPGIFTAGDVHDIHYRQAVTAAGFGCMAGMEVLKYLDKNTPSW